MQGSYLGPEYSQKEIEENLTGLGAKYEILDDNNLLEKTANDIASGRAIGWFQGRMEFGPRALGNRSLLADPRGHDIKDKVNAIKKRQKFRPFAPVILAEHARDYFEMSWEDSPYMQYTSRCKYPDLFPAIVHADGTSRVQTVTKEQHSGLYDLLSRWYEETGCPMLLNTSLNIKTKFSKVSIPVSISRLNFQKSQYQSRYQD